MKSINNIFFLYDYSIIKFLNEYRDIKEPVKYFTLLDKHLLPFFHYFDKLSSEKSEKFIGMTIFLDKDKKYKILLVTDKSSIEFRTAWIHKLGSQISKFNDFSKEPFFIYSTINYKRDLTTSKEK